MVLYFEVCLISIGFFRPTDRQTDRQRIPVTEQCGDLSVVAGDGLRPLERLTVPVHRRRRLVLADQLVAFLLQLLRHLVPSVER